MAKVIKIPQTLNTKTRLPITGKVKLRVCAYARVSTDSDEQFTSFEAQVDYYKNYIKARSNWEYVGTYADEGISGTNTKKRDGFNKMIEDALAGKIDLIVTKSVSRFARNTVDSLTTIRKLKDKNIGCYFEKENINTLDGGGELLITIMSSFAQEESRSISENVTWGQRKRFSDGKFSIAFKYFLGYERGPNGELKIVPEEAEIIRNIYGLYMQGYTVASIKNILEANNVKSPKGTERWHNSTINSILRNEKYKGDALLQKSFTTDFLQKKHKKNEGEIAQYYVQGSHEAIIAPEEWDMVQVEMKRRSELGASYTSRCIFSSKIKCGCCGGFYGSKLWHSNDKYRTTVWQCNNKYKKGKEKCLTPNLKEEQIKAAFLKAYNQIMVDKATVIEDCRMMKSIICNVKELKVELEKQGNEVDMVREHMKLLVDSNSSKTMNQEQYKKKYDDLKVRYDLELEKYNEISKKIDAKNSKGKVMEAFITNIKKQDSYITEWSDYLWNIMLESVTVNPDRTLTFKFYSGNEVTTQ